MSSKEELLKRLSDGVLDMEEENYGRFDRRNEPCRSAF